MEEDLCDKCCGWRRGSDIANDHDPTTWCLCSVFQKDTKEEESPEED